LDLKGTKKMIIVMLIYYQNVYTSKKQNIETIFLWGQSVNEW